MKLLKIAILGAVTFAATAFTPAAQADDHRHHWNNHHRHHYYSHGRVVVYGSPRYYYDDYYRPRYYSRRYYSSGPSVSIGFGGHRWSDHRRHW